MRLWACVCLVLASSATAAPPPKLELLPPLRVARDRSPSFARPVSYIDRQNAYSKCATQTPFGYYSCGYGFGWYGYYGYGCWYWSW